MTGAIIAMFEILQYLTFLLFLNTELPPACDDFISTLFENTVELGAILNEIIIKLNIKDINFAFGYDLDVSKKVKIFRRHRNSRKKRLGICSFSMQQSRS